MSKSLQDDVLYPNPATNTIHINGSIKSYEIYNLLGKKVANGNSPTNGQFSISKLQMGQYLIKLETETDIFIKKFIKI